MDPFQALISRRRKKPIKRRGILPIAALGGLGLLSQLGNVLRKSKFSRKKKYTRKGRSMPKFISNEDKLILDVIKRNSRMKKNTKRKTRRRRRRGDLSADFLQEFGDIDVPSTEKTTSRLVFDKLKEALGSDLAGKLRRDLATKAKDSLLNIFKRKPSTTKTKKITEKNLAKIYDDIYKNPIYRNLI